MLLRFILYVMLIRYSYDTDTHRCHVPRPNSQKVIAVCITHKPVVMMPSRLVPGSQYPSKTVTTYYEHGHGDPIETADPAVIERVEDI
jgi:hypothetical protein